MSWHIVGSLSKEGYDKQYSDKQLLSRLLPYLFHHKFLLIIVLLLSLLETILSLLYPFAFAMAFDELFKSNPSLSTIYTMSSFFTILLISSWIIRYFYQIQSSKLESNIIYELRAELFKRVNQHDLSFFDKNKTGKIMARISGDTFQLGGVLSTIVDLGSIILRAIIIIIALVLINSELSIASFMIFPFLFLIIFLLRKLTRRYSLLQRRAESSINASVEESINGIQITKSFGQENSAIEAYNQLQQIKVRVNVKQSTLFRSFGPLLDFLTAIGLFIILFSGGNLVSNSLLTPGILYLFFTYLERLFIPLIELSTFYATLQGGFAAGERIFSMMDIPTKMKSGSVICPQLEGDIEFINVYFSYDLKKGYVFKNLSFFIPRGQTLAVVGETGAGKTSLVSILNRMYEIESGTILLDRKFDIQTLETDSLNAQFGYVLQDPFLFNGSILHNMTLGSPNVSEEKVHWALDSVGANSFISQLPDGIHTNIKERGKGLSQGQKQLLALARILVKDPKILILDEATSSVDIYTEKMIQDALNLIFKNRTTIVIAHRLSTIINADRILVLDKGIIVEDGTHNELINKTSGLYRNLYEMYYAHQGIIG